MSHPTIIMPSFTANFVMLIVFSVLLSARAGDQMAAQAVFNPDPGASLRPSTPVIGAEPPSTPAGNTMTNSAYNPDPGAALQPSPTPFYKATPGTPPDYGTEPDAQQSLNRGTLAQREYMRKEWKNESYPANAQMPPYTAAFPDRWRLDIPVWRRYNTPETETAYMDQDPKLFDPYKQSVLKGDLPILGQDYFLSLSGTSFTSYEARNIPTPSGVSTASANSSEFYGQGDEMELDQFFLMNVDFFKGETAFKPVTWLIHVEPVYNINTTWVKEAGVLSADPRGQSTTDAKSVLFGASTSQNAGSVSAANNGGINNPSDAQNFLQQGGLRDAGSNQLGSPYTERSRDFFSLEQGFVEVHLADLSNNYDFTSLRAGNQPFNSDFRGFIFDDTNLGSRLFGNMDSNRWQYNVAAFDMREKDTYSELNTFDNRNQYVFVANTYRQDLFVPGYTGEVNLLANVDEGGGFHYDRSGFLVRPEPLGAVEAHQVHAYYLGLNGDGHFGHFNVNNSLYEVVGTDQFNGLAGREVNINAQMAALELSYDFDWLRFKASFFYASGDGNPTSSKASGFDSIDDNPNFIGGPFSYYNRQGFNLGGTSVNFKNQDSLLPDIRSSKFEGQSNFVNPGVLIYGLGVDADVMPNLKVSLNTNWIEMAQVAPINYALQTNLTSPEIGYDLSIGANYRPLLTDNIIISSGLGTLLPGAGYRTIYRAATDPVPGYSTAPSGYVDDFLYSAFVSLTLTY